MSKINLIPEVRQKKIKIAQTNKMVTSAAVILAVATVAAALSLAAYAAVLTTQKSMIEGNIVKVQDSLDTMKDLETTVANLENGLLEIKGIIAGDKNWNNLMGHFEKFTPSDIQITNFAVEGGRVTLSLKGKEVKSIDRFITSFSNAKNPDKKNYFSDVVVNGYNKDEASGVTFTAKFNLNEAVVW